ncbi:MAG: hypothetical protein P8L43_04665 [Candidatus Marinimicrobia bacterium]|jgi:hypothetical protein|nr:hypothetical protein [Candidatus Neomarinimicrobiota bacterium]
MRISIYFLMLIFSNIFVFAQDSKSSDIKELANSEAMKEVQDLTVEIRPYPSDVLRDFVTKSLGKKGKALGQVNNDGTIYNIGAASTGVPSNRSGFIASRNVAFRKAVLIAKSEFIRAQGMKISSEEGLTILDNYIEGTDPETQKKASFLQKLGKLANQSIDKALIELGVSQTEVSKMNQGAKEAMFRDEYRQKGLQFAAGMLKGLSVCKIVEGEVGGNDYQIAVLVKYSKENQALAAMIQDDINYQLDLQKPSKTLNKIKNAEPKDLLPRMGVLTTVDKNGQSVVLAYGQSEIRKTGSRQSAAETRAFAQAANIARDNLKNFIAQDIALEEITENAEVLSSYADGTSDFFSQNKFEQSIKSKMSSVNNLRSYEMKRWKVQHPQSGHMVAGVVIAWSKNFADKSRDVQKTLNKSNSDLFIEDNTLIEKNNIPPSESGDYLIGGDDEDF